jgi:putative ABC transport system ATP-binding protein
MTEPGELTATIEPPMEPGPVVVRLEGVTKTFRRGPEQVHALREVTLSLRRHELVALVGPSGSGKSTLLNVLCGWEHPESGVIVWSDGAGKGEADADQVHLKDRPWSELAVLPQRLGLVEELSVRENIALPVRLAGGGKPPRDDEAHREPVEQLLVGLGLDGFADRSPSEISLGEQQRTALARALVLRPTLLLADEPTGHQDEGWGRVVLRTLRAAAHGGMSCLLATHNEEAIQFAGRVLAIRDGRVRQASKRDEEAAPDPSIPFWKR